MVKILKKVLEGNLCAILFFNYYFEKTTTQIWDYVIAELKKLDSLHLLEDALLHVAKNFYNSKATYYINYYNGANSKWTLKEVQSSVSHQKYLKAYAYYYVYISCNRGSSYSDKLSRPSSDFKETMREYIQDALRD